MVTTLCDLTGKKKGDYCRVCGWVLPWDVPNIPKRPCGNDVPSRTSEQLAADAAAHEKYLGDKLKEALEATTFFGLLPGGITPELVKAVKAELGFAPTCDCPERQEWLNNADKLARSWKRKGIAWLKRKLSGG